MGIRARELFDWRDNEMNWIL